MTEGEWLASADTVAMLELLGIHAGERKMRLFACACCRRHSHRVEGTYAAKAIEVVEEYVDGRASSKRLVIANRFGQRAAERFHDQFQETGEVAADIAHVHASACGAAAGRVRTDHPPCDIARQAVIYATMACAHEMVGDVRLYYSGDWKRFQAAELALHTATLREIFGNPFRPIAFVPAWRTTDTMLLARGIYDDRAFDRMPILADALQEAGCDSDELLNHLRDPDAAHVCGCWALDLVLGKE